MEVGDVRSLGVVSKSNLEFFIQGECVVFFVTRLDGAGGSYDHIGTYHFLANILPVLL